MSLNDQNEVEAIERPLDVEALKSFQFERTLSESTLTGSCYLLGKIDNEDVILHVQRTALNPQDAPGLITSGLKELDVYLDNKPYYSSHGTLLPSKLPDLVLKIIWPATEAHIKKYTAQERVMITETREMFEQVVVPYIESFPAERIAWVFNILEGKKEADRVLYKNDDSEKGFLILPDLKWDQTSMTALYLTVIVQTRSIRCLRDLQKEHLDLLKDIKKHVFDTVMTKFGVANNKLRLFVHYHPSYYHFHVHVVHIQHEAMAGMIAGQAHLLDDLITLLELSLPSPAPSILAQMNLTYALGVEHGLYQAFVKAGHLDTST